MPVKGWGQVKDWEQELAQADHPRIRLLQSKHVTSLTPSDNPQVTGDGWQVCSAQSVENFSSVAYFFARKLQQELGVPIGVIDSSWGGTPAEAWTSAPTLTHVIEHQRNARAILSAHGDRDALCRKYDQDVLDWQATYSRADQDPVTSQITRGFNGDYTWSNATFYKWGDQESGLPNNYCKYSFYGYIRCDDSGNLWIIRNGVQQQFSSIPAAADLPPVRYILPYPNLAIQRSAGAYKNYYGY